MDASQITKLLQKQNTRYINRCQTVDSSTLIWKNQIQSSKYIKGVKTCNGEQNCNVPTNPCCADQTSINGVVQNTGTYSFGGSGRTTSLQNGSPQHFLNVLSGAAGSAAEVYSSERILLQQAGKESCGVPGTSPAPENSYVVLPACYCVNTNGPTNSSSSELDNPTPLPINNQSNPFLPPFDTYYKFKNPISQCQYPVQDQNQKHFVQQCHSRFPNANNGVNVVFSPCDNVTDYDPITKKFHTANNNPPTCEGCIIEPTVPPVPPIENVSGWPAFIVSESGEAFSYAVSEDGNRVYITGFFQGSVNLYNGGVVDTTTEPPVIQLITSPTLYDGFLACYSISGQLLWATVIETRTPGGATQGFAVSDDATGVYVTGIFNGPIDFYNGISSGILDGTSPAVASLDLIPTPIVTSAQFTVKFNTSGILQWVTQVDNVPYLNGPPTPAGLTYGVSSNGTDVYVVGYYVENTTIYNADTTTKGSIAYELNVTTNYNSYFLIKYNTNGQVLWLTQGISPSELAFGFSLTCDINAVYISVFYNSVLEYCQTVPPSPGPSYTNPAVINTVFSSYYGSAIIAYNSLGSFLWIANNDDTVGYQNIAHTMSVDSNGLYVLSQFSEKQDIYSGSNGGPVDPVTVANPNPSNIGFSIVKYVINDANPLNNGKISWIQQINGPPIGPPYFILGSSISSDGAGVYVTVTLDSDIDLYNTGSATGPGGGIVTLNKISPPGDLDIFIMKYDTSGNLIWMNLAEGIGNNYGNGIIADGTSVYLTGSSNDKTNFYNADGLNQPSVIGVTIDPGNTNNYTFTAKYNTDGQVIKL